MSQIADQTYLRKQYQNASNLNDRIRIHVRFSTNRYGWHPWVFDQIKLPEHALVLELGCGPGRLWKENLGRIPTGWEIMLTDFSPGMLEEARRNLAGVRRFAFEVADAQALPFNDAGFDAVIANHMLYHVPDRTRAFAEIRRVLRPTGRCYAATNGEAHLREMHDLVRQFDPTIGMWRQPGDQTFTIEQAQSELSHHFSHVLLHRYESALVVTEAEPLVAFVASMADANLTGARRAEFTRVVEQRIVADGAIHITKDTGLFEVY